MRTLQRDLKIAYLCKRIPNTEPVQFDEPVEVRLNLITTNSRFDISIPGDEVSEFLRATITSDVKSMFNKRDRLYVNVVPPLTHDKLCNTADFEIDSILDSISTTKLLFRKINGK